MSIFRNLLMQQKGEDALPDGVVTGTFYITDSSKSVQLIGVRDSFVEYVKVDGEVVTSPTKATFPVGLHTAEIKFIYDKFDDEDYGFWFRNTPYNQLNVSSIDTSKVDCVYNMFSGMSNLTSIDLSAWNLPKGACMFRRMFEDCTSLTEVKLPLKWAGKVVDFTYSFYGCTSMTELDLSPLSGYTGSNTFESTFQNMTSLKELNISGFRLDATYTTYNMFTGCSNLKIVKAIGCSDTTISNIQSALSSLGTWTLTDGIFTKS